jgi:hypothetical protein
VLVEELTSEATVDGAETIEAVLVGGMAVVDSDVWV